MVSVFTRKFHRLLNLRLSLPSAIVPLVNGDSLMRPVVRGPAHRLKSFLPPRPLTPPGPQLPQVHFPRLRLSGQTLETKLPPQRLRRHLLPPLQTQCQLVRRAELQGFLYSKALKPSCYDRKATPRFIRRGIPVSSGGIDPR